MLNRGLLINSEKKCKRAYGVGVYPGDRADLIAMGLSPMEGCEDPASENFGNYVHTNGSVMVFIPAFVYRFGRASAPSFSRDGENAVEIKFAPDVDIPAGTTDVNWSPGDGWVLARAFIDGGRVKSGFFIDKYICSKSADGQSAVSVKRGVPLNLSTEKDSNSSTMPGCVGEPLDVFALGRARGSAYSCTTIFQWAALSLLSLAWGQQVKSSVCCAWYDPNNQTNFPKGVTANSPLRDVNDRSITFEPATSTKEFAKAGSGVPFSKTTHNGQDSGVSDVSGNVPEVFIGVMQANKDAPFFVLKESSFAHDLLTVGMSSHFDPVVWPRYNTGPCYWGNGKTFAFSHETSGPKRAMCAVYPASHSATSSAGSSLFGKDAVTNITDFNIYVEAAPIRTYGISGNASEMSGIWSRNGDGTGWNYQYGLSAFRISAYAN